MATNSDTNTRVSLDNSLHVIACIGILAVFVVYAVLPVYRNYSELNGRVARMKCEQVEYTVLLPFFAELNSALGRPKIDALKAIEVESLNKEDFASMHILMQGMAERCGLNLQKTIPHVRAVSDETHFLGLNISVEGEFIKMQMFVQMIMQMPSFFHLESLEIMKYEGHEKLGLQIWLSVN